MEKQVGILANQGDATSTLRLIERADELGIPMAWLALGGPGPDSLILFGAAAMRTRQIGFGTAIVPIWPSHPLALVRQAMAVDALAPGRLRLGVGPSSPLVTQVFGVTYERPLAHIREYVTILKAFFAEGEVQFDGQYYQAHTSPRPPGGGFQARQIPVLASALQRGSFRLCGEVTDGALSWLCPWAYLRDVALPALQEGAAQAQRPTPPLIAHVPIAVHENADEVRQAVRAQFGFYPRLPHYQRMFIAAGFPETAGGQWSDRMIEAVAVYGDENKVRRQVAGIFATGISEIMAHPVPAGADPAGSMERVLGVIGGMREGGSVNG